MIHKVIKIFSLFLRSFLRGCGQSKATEKADLGQILDNKISIPTDNVASFFAWTEKDQWKKAMGSSEENFEAFTSELSGAIKESVIYKEDNYNNGRMSGYQIQYKDNTWMELKYETKKRDNIDGYLFYLYGPIIDSYYQLNENEGIIGVAPKKDMFDLYRK